MKFLLNLTIAISCCASPLAAFAQTPVLLRTFNNPTPEAADYFGLGLAALGNDRVLISAPYDDTTATNAGAVYLFQTNGTLLTTITNPNPAFAFSYPEGQFGSAVAALGSDRVVIGSSVSQKVYLFTTNGTLVTTLISPSIYDTAFGYAVAAFGSDRVLIGSTSAYLGTDPDSDSMQGAAFLFGTNGATPQKIFFNQNPWSVGLFGYSVGAFGSDRALVGSWTGDVFLFHTNGTLLTTFSAPGIYNQLGRQVAAVGTDRVLVSSHATGALTEGVHLFNTNGTLLLTITNPTPATGDSFGHSIAVLGNDRLVIGAPGDDTTGTNSGAAYVFNLDGALLATINNPAPGVWFGLRLAPFGDDCVLIGEAGQNGTGAAYLFRIPSAPIPPSLTIQRTTTNTVVVSWPSTAAGFVLQQNTEGLNSMNWSNVTTTPQDNGTTKALIVSPTGGNRYYRLIRD
ncbi:MAG TPA: FG-GAP repeat protein [Verrucomicrobiae bacterium]|nr:FG-GAP repeat protein [Verrucomicrobiae bacterium]